MHEHPGEASFRPTLIESKVADGWQTNEVLMRPAPGMSGAYTSGGYREGVTPEGHDYRYYEDLSGYVAGWAVRCEKDKMNDETNCFTTDPNKILMIYMRRGQPSAACVLKHDFPGRDAMLRIGTKPPQSAGRKGCLDWSRASGVTKASDATVRYWQFPYDHPRDVQSSLEGVNSALGLAGFLYKNRGRLSF